MKALATLSASFSGTNRFVSADKDYGRINKWAASGSQELLRNDPLFEQVTKAIQAIEYSQANEMHMFRGRSPPFSSEQPTRDEMGPPPPGATVTGRYSIAGESVLYLSSERAGVSRELAESTGPIWIQKFNIPAGQIRVADFSTGAVSNHKLLNTVMWFAELAGGQGYPTTIFSQLIASLVAEKFDAMLAPGVRGDETVQYNNLVVFRSNTLWKQWLSAEPPEPA